MEEEQDSFDFFHSHQKSPSSSLMSLPSSSWPYLDMEDDYNSKLLSLMNGSLTNNSGNGSLGPDIVDLRDWSIPWWRQLLWYVLFSGMVIVAAVGNSIVIWIVLAHKRMRTVTNYLLVNLSIADAMVSTLNVLPNFIYMISGNWPFGEFYCKLVQFVAVVSIVGSVFSLMCIAFDRYTAILNPLRPRMGKRLTLGICALIWVVGCIIGAPFLIFCTTFESPISETEKVVLCYSEWPDGPQTESNQEFWYNVLFMIFTYFVPITVMGYTYTWVGIELWGSKSIGECTQRQLDNIKSKRRVVKMMIVVVIIFAFCWLPFHVYFIWVSLWPGITQAFFVREMYLGIYWLAMSNSMYNPIIYCWMNARFRRGFQQVFRWCPFIEFNEAEAISGVVLHPEMTRRCRPQETTRQYSVTGAPDNDNHTRVTTNGTSTVHIPLHVLTSTTDGKICNSTTTTHYLAPPNHRNGQNERVRSHNLHNHRYHGKKNSTCNSEFM